MKNFIQFFMYWFLIYGLLSCGGDSSKKGSNNLPPSPLPTRLAISSSQPALDDTNKAAYVVKGTCPFDSGNDVIVKIGTPDTTPLSVSCQSSDNTFSVTIDASGVTSNPATITATQGTKEATKTIDHHRPDFLSINLGESHSCAILKDKNLKCWGSNSNGQLGLGDTEHRGDDPNEMGGNLPIIPLGANRTAQSVATGASYTCAILDNDWLKCWGGNSTGQLGLGDTEHRGDDPNEMGDNLPTIDLGSDRTAKAIGAGNHHTCALLDNNFVKCWGGFEAGDGPNGALGQGHGRVLGDNAGEMGDNLPVIDLGSNGTRTAKAISVGAFHTCALLDNDLVKCWGGNSSGQLGLGDKEPRGDDPNEMGDNLPTIDLGSDRTAKRIHAGYVHTCALLDNDWVKCWGEGIHGRLGQGNENKLGDNAGEMGDNLLKINLGLDRTAKMIAPGNHSVCALLDNDLVKCWGAGNRGQLGQGNTNALGDASDEMGEDLPFVTLGQGKTVQSIKASLGGGGDYFCALLNDNSVKCWGLNNFGQLGLGDTENRGDDPNEMGDYLHGLVLE